MLGAGQPTPPTPEDLSRVWTPSCVRRAGGFLHSTGVCAWECKSLAWKLGLTSVSVG